MHTVYNLRWASPSETLFEPENYSGYIRGSHRHIVLDNSRSNFMQNLWLVEIAIPWPFRGRVSMNSGSKWISFRLTTRHSGDSGHKWGIGSEEGSIQWPLYSEQIPLF